MNLRARDTFDKYRIVRRLAMGGFAAVYEALDTVEGIRVALKIPHDRFVRSEGLDCFRQEIRLTARLDHPNILPIKTANVIKGHLVIVYPLAQKTLDARMKSRMGIPFIMDFATQILDALSHAHQNKVIHCDLKPDNILLFRNGTFRLADFGIAKLAMRTVSASGSGTLGYIAPEQAFGKPSPASDVFSLGLILTEMLTRQRPEWPFKWPPPNIRRIRERLPASYVQLLQKALEVNQRRRFSDASRFFDAHLNLVDDVLAFDERRRRRARRR